MKRLALSLFLGLTLVPCTTAVWAQEPQKAHADTPLWTPHALGLVSNEDLRLEKLEDQMKAQCESEIDEFWKMVDRRIDHESGKSWSKIIDRAKTADIERLSDFVGWSGYLSEEEALKIKRELPLALKTITATHRGAMALEGIRIPNDVAAEDLERIKVFKTQALTDATKIDSNMGLPKTNSFEYGKLEWRYERIRAASKDYMCQKLFTLKRDRASRLKRINLFLDTRFRLKRLIDSSNEHVDLVIDRLAKQLRHKLPEGHVGSSAEKLEKLERHLGLFPLTESETKSTIDPFRFRVERVAAMVEATTAKALETSRSTADLGQNLKWAEQGMSALGELKDELKRGPMALVLDHLIGGNSVDGISGLESYGRLFLGAGTPDRLLANPTQDAQTERPFLLP